MIEGTGAPPQVCVIIEWPSKEAAEAFYASEQYQPYLDARLRGASNEFVLVAGEDMTAVASI